MKKLFALFALIVAVIAGAWAFLRRYLPQTTGVVLVPGLKARTEILRDRWGVPHIYADSEDDLFFAQGYIHAQDRMWQMELLRRVATGRLSEVLGEPGLELDRLMRVVGLHRAAAAEAGLLDPESRRVLEAYAAGVNAYMQERAGHLSLEFTLLRHRPEPWKAVDTLGIAKLLSFNLGGNWASEIIRARLTARLGAELAADLEPPYPANNPTVVSGAGIPDGAQPPPNGWGGSAIKEALRLVETLLPSGEASGRAGPTLPGVSFAGGASNQWVVSGERTETGKPLLANDTHMAVSLPALWYQVHLVGGRYNVAGICSPGAPGIIIGHNEHCAWGMTIGWQDVQDLYQERLNPANSRQYEVNGTWQDGQIVRELIHVKGRGEPVLEEVMLTRHGPSVQSLTGDEPPISLRDATMEPGRQMCSVLALNRARDWESFRAALADWQGPSANFNYADTEGNIGLLQAGRVPVRARGFGIAPVPGWTDEHEWQRYLTVDELPQVLNPDGGWTGTANNLVVDESYPHFLSTDLENPSRAARLADLVTAQDTATAADFARFQRDTYSDQARRFVQLMKSIQPTNIREHSALTYLREWDHRMEADSVAATIYSVCRLRALHLVFDRHLGDLADSYVGLGISAASERSPYHDRSFVRLLNMLEDPTDTTWLKDPNTGIPTFPQELLHKALRQALKLLREELGDDITQWTWGRVNRVHFAHPVGSVKPFHLLFNRGPYPTAGDQDTMLRAVGKPVFPFEPVLGIDLLRFVADLSDWDRCRIMVPGGQSGHVASHHYADLIPLWRDGILLSMPFSRQAVERHAQERLTLVP